MKKLISLVAILCLIGCATYQKPPQQNFVKVLGVTTEGDTILIDINWNRYPYNNYYWNPPVIINTPKPKPNRPTINRPRPNYNSKPIEKPNKNPKKN